MKRSFEESPFFTPLFLDGDVYEYEALTFHNDLETMRKQKLAQEAGPSSLSGGFSADAPGPAHFISWL